MKLTRKLIPAFAMLLVSAVLMSTASFAWFSMNGAVNATGFEVKATAPAALWISDKNADFGTDVSFALGEGKTAPTISPVTRKTGDNSATNADSWIFYGLTKEGLQSVNENGKVDLVWEDVKDNEGKVTTPANVQADTTNFVQKALFLRLEGANGGTIATTDKMNVKAKVTVKSSGSDLIYQALRVALVTDGKAGAGTTANTTSFSTSGVAEYEFTKLNEATGAVNDATLTTIAAQESVKVYVYIWFEGVDDECKNSYAQNLDTLTIDIAFTAEPLSTNTGGVVTQ